MKPPWSDGTVMEVIGGTPTGATRAEQVLGRVEAHLDPAYDVLKISRMALGDAPISFASTAVGGLLRAVVGRTDDPRTNAALGHAGLAADGLFRGLFYAGGLLHAPVARRLPWLVVPSTPPAGFAGLAKGLSGMATTVRLGLLGIGGVLGALRAAHAVARQGSAEALVTTKEGRTGALQALGSVLLMVKHPATYLAGAGLFGVAIVSEFL